MADVFISYSGKSPDAAEQIADELDRRGANSLNIGKWRITRTSYQREQLDVSALKAYAPEAYLKCCRTCKCSRLTVTM